MNNQKNSFQLIDGIFTPEQARQILGAMVKSKIDYHCLEKLSETERLGIKGNSEERLVSLRTLDADLKKLLDSEGHNGRKFDVKVTIQIIAKDFF